MMLPSCSSLGSMKPPLATFLASLLLLFLTSLSLALYIHSREDLVNPDILDWNRLLTEMEELKYCLPTPSISSAPSTTLPANVTRASIPLSSSLFALLPPNSASFLARGQVPLDHMGLGHRGQQVEVSLLQLPGLPSLCMGVRGDPALLQHLDPSFTSPACSNITLLPAPAFTVHAARHLPRTWCSEVAALV